MGLNITVDQKNTLPVKTKQLLMNALVIGHLHYPAIRLSGISPNLTISLEKQLSWAIRTCFDCANFYSSSDLKINYNVLPVTMFLD